MSKLISPTVVNKYKEPFDVYIGRGSYWGNPFPIDESKGDTREVVIAKCYEHYRNLYRQDPQRFIIELKALSGKRLGCFCKPKACHGDIIVIIFNKLIKILNKGDC